MQTSLFSPRWHRVAHLHPQLRQHVRLKRQDQRGVTWFLLLDPSAEEVRRLNRIAYEFVGRCDGQQSVQQIWDALLAQIPEQVMTQDEVVRLLIALHERGLIECDVAPDVESMFRSRHARQRRISGSANPLSFRLMLVDPSKLLDWLAPLGRVLFSEGAFASWLLMVVAAGLAACLHRGELSAHTALLTESPRSLFIAWLMYPLIKAVHEAAHGLAIQRWGGKVRQAGISMLMLTPVPYVGASAADGFRHRHQRAIVSAAGIMAELAIAAVAMGVWLVAEPGLVRDISLLAMLIGGVSTVLANGNPLMRFDGYYLFTDLLDLRNLGPRSTRFWIQWLSRRVLGVPQADQLDVLPGEAPWLVAYVPLALAYRVMLSIGVALWIGGHSALAGALVGASMLVSTVGKPLRSALRAVAAAGSARSIWRAGAPAATLLTLAACVPVPFSTLAQGVVWVPEAAQIRAGTEGFIVGFAVADGAAVKAGDLLLTLRDEHLQAEKAQLAADATDLDVEMFSALQVETHKLPALREKLAYSVAEAARNADRSSRLEVRAQAAGTLVMPHQAEQLGSFHKKGDVLGYVLTGQPVTVRVALPQEEADLARSHPAGVAVRLSDEAGKAHPGRLHASAGAARTVTSAEQDSGAVARLPSAALGEKAGGAIATDGADKDGLTTREPVVLLDVDVAEARSTRIGARAWVRFDHGTAPICEQALRKLQQMVLQHFNPAG